MQTLASRGDRPPRFAIVAVLLDPKGELSATPEGYSMALDSVLALRGDPEIVVVNNTPMEQAPECHRFLRQWVRRTPVAQLVQETTNRGIAGGFNDGVAALSHSADYLILMSGDALIVDPELLNVLHQSFEACRNVGCLHPLSFFEDAPERCNYSFAFDPSGFRSMRASDPELALEREKRLRGEVDAMLRRVRRHRRWVSAPVFTLPLTFFCVRFEVFAALEGFDEGFVCGHENNDLVLRARRRGWTARVARRTLVLHRRMLFRSLGQTGNADSVYHHLAGNSAAHWRDKYGDATARHLFREAHWGTIIGKHVIPLADPPRRALALGPLLRKTIGRLDGGYRR